MPILTITSIKAIFPIFALMIRNITILLLLSAPVCLSAQKKEPSGPRIIREWNLSSDFTEEVPIPFDTVFSLFHRYRLADRYSPLNATLGSYGLPFYQINFFDRISDPDKFLCAYIYPFIYSPERAVFMNTQVPFTEAVWTYAGKRELSEQTFRFRHSQNVNRFLNFGLIYDIVYNLGQYSYQKADDKAFTFYSSYIRTKYKMYFSAGINNLISNENGGITGADNLKLFELTRDVPVNLGGLNDSKSTIKNKYLLLVQRYTLGKKSDGKDTLAAKPKGFAGLSGTLSHILILEYNKKTYSDKYPGSGFYDTAFINSSATYDSLYSRVMKNTIRFDFATDETRKFRLGGGVGIRNELFKYSQIIPTHDTTFADTASWKRSNNVLTGKLLNDIGEKFMWIANGELFLTGYRVGDFILNGKISKSFTLKKGNARWDITGSVMNRQPSFWMEQWGSNNFEWHNSLKKEFRTDIGTILSYPARMTELKFNYAIIDNYTDFNTSALPSQHEGGLSVAAITARKELKAWKFHLATDLLVQKSSNRDILDLPLFTARASGFFEHLFIFRQTNGKLNIQLGVDVLYHTLYNSYSWMPATGRFYRQDQTKTGNYPFLNIFLNLKIQRTRIFLMYDHVNSKLTGYNYFFVPSYPLNIRMFRYGLAWTFYN
jgi:hypothetical protein